MLVRCDVVVLLIDALRLQELREAAFLDRSQIAPIDRALEGGLQFGVIKLQEQIALPDLRAFDEIDRDYLAVGLGLQFHALIGAERAGGGDLLGQRRAHHGDGRDAQGRNRSTTLRGGRGRRRLATEEWHHLGTGNRRHNRDHRAGHQRTFYSGRHGLEKDSRGMADIRGVQPAAGIREPSTNRGTSSF
jgi:hypothetical protein